MEAWRPIPGYEGKYRVSNEGSVESFQRRSPRRLKAQIHPQGYWYVTLWANGKAKVFTVHSLVLMAFVGPRPDGMVVRHLNGDPADNRIVNLVYGTPSENQRDSVHHGTQWHKNKTHCPRGHAYSPQNTYIRPNGGRKCRACNRDRQRSLRS